MAVVEEQTVKDGDHIHRRADVMVTSPRSGRFAFEVEYKAWSSEAWRRKQNDYEAAQVGCVWLVGHSRVTGLTGNEVKVPGLAAAIAGSDVPVLVVNPHTRQVGTLLADPAGTTRFTGRSATAHLAVDDLADCRLDPVHGIMTPTLARVLVSESNRSEADKARDALRARIHAKEQAESEAWMASPLRSALLEKFGKVPVPVTAASEREWAIEAHRQHWHAVVCLDVLAAVPVGQTITLDDCAAALTRHSIPMDASKPSREKALVGYLKMLAAHDMVRPWSGSWTVAQTLDDWWNAANAERARKADEKTRRETAVLQEQEAQEQRARAAARRAPAGGPEAVASHAAEWETSDLRARVVSQFGTVPAAISWNGQPHQVRFGTHHASWHACLVLELMADVGVEFTLAEAVSVLEVREFVDPDAVELVDDYCSNLVSRGFLAQSGEDAAWVPVRPIT